MKHIDYMGSHEDENLSWCKPYVDDTGKYALILHEGNVDAISTPDGIVYGDALTADALEAFARTVNEYYDDYSGWDDLLIAIAAMHETGCAHCPCKDDCDAMANDMDD